MHRWPLDSLRSPLDSLRSLGAALVGALVALVLLPPVATAQTNPAAQSAQLWRLQHERAILDELMTLLAVPNVSSDKPNIQRNAELIAKMIEARGLTPKLASVPGGNPVVVTDIRTPGATRTIGLYAHYDGQPLDPKEWASPPFEPVIKKFKAAFTAACV